MCSELGLRPADATRLIRFRSLSTPPRPEIHSCIRKVESRCDMLKSGLVLFGRPPSWRLFWPSRTMHGSQHTMPAESIHGAKPHREPQPSRGDMEPIIAGRELRKSWGATLVLEHADFLLHAGDKVALVGPNGSGKSTLFRLLAGETAPDLGDLVLKPGLRYGYLPQVPNVPPETVVRDVLSAPSPEAQRIEADLAGLEAWMARPDAWDAADASARMARYEALPVARGAARSQSVIVNDPILNDLGVGEELLDQRFGSLSGGEKSKVLTARALANAKEKDVLLLDTSRRTTW